jgi:hypothetical protein|tara:strand:- start:1123 stop:1311 length:189 start_codon:yes stop_codon:yes gene_type:complete
MSKNIFIAYGHHNLKNSFNAAIRDTFIAACATTAAAQGGKRLSGGRIQAIFASDSRQLGECR